MNSLEIESIPFIHHIGTTQAWEFRWEIIHTPHIGMHEGCAHDWCEREIERSTTTSCCVLHDLRGCPDTWKKKERICRKCLQHEMLKEVRYYPEVMESSEFEQLFMKIQAVHQTELT